MFAAQLLTNLAARPSHPRTPTSTGLGRQLLLLFPSKHSICCRHFLCCGWVSTAFCTAATWIPSYRFWDSRRRQTDRSSTLVPRLSILDSRFSIPDPRHDTGPRTPRSATARPRAAAHHLHLPGTAAVPHDAPFDTGLFPHAATVLAHCAPASARLAHAPRRPSDPSP